MLYLIAENLEIPVKCEDLISSSCVFAFQEGSMFREPVQKNSASKEWSMTLTVDIATITYDWLELKRRLYNGNAAGPTITVKRGDQLTLNLVNYRDHNICLNPVKNFGRTTVRDSFLLRPVRS